MARIPTKTFNLSFISKTLLSFCIIIIIITLSYLVINNRKSLSNMHFLVSSLALPSQISPTQCILSMEESDGWFCEFESDWKRRKKLHHIQNKRNRISDGRDRFFQNNWNPTIQCEFERRIGSPADGGKWVCDIHRFAEINNTNLLIYSFGSDGDFTFEEAVKYELPKAEIHTFDKGVYQCPDGICKYHQALLGDGKNDSSKSLQMIINELGHQKREIHILKVDIEGSEFNFFEELFNSSTKTQADIPYIRQILFEVHLKPNDTSVEPSLRTHKLFELFRSNNYAIFHKETNLFDPWNIFEFALLRLNPAFFVSPL